MKRNMRSVLAIALAAAMAAGTLAGCGGSANTAETKAAAGAESTGAKAEANGGEKVLKFGCQMYSDGLIDPVSQTNTAWNCMRFGIGECLFKFDDAMVPQPWLAEAYETEDFQTWTFTIRKGVKFSDGCDMTPTKVAESLQYLITEGPNFSSSPQKYIDLGSKITADDAAGTVTIELEKPNVNFRGCLAYPVCEITDVADVEDRDTKMIGTGPYAVESFEDQVGYKMVKNEYYYETVPYDRVEILFMGDASAKAMALQNGQVDLVENITNVADIQKFKEDDKYTVSIASGVRCGFAWMNQRDGRVLANETLRKAILMGIDYDTICNSNTIGGLYTPGFSVLPSTLSYGYDKLNNPYAYDPEAAMKLMDDAGIVDTDGDGIRELDGQNINLVVVSYENRLLNDFADAQAQYLAEIGIGTTAKYGSSDDEWNALVAGEYDLNQNNWTTVGTGDPREYMANWYGKSESNYCGFQNDEYDELYEAYLDEKEDAKRAELVQGMQQILVDNAAAIIDGYYNSSMIYSKNVGYAKIHTADYYWVTTEIVPAE